MTKTNTAPKKARAKATSEEVTTAAPVDLASLGIDGNGGKCPHCGADHTNGFIGYDDLDKAGKGTMGHEFACLGCGGEWGPVIVRRATSKPTGTGLPIEKNREKQNGVARPSVGGKCRAVWDWLDAHPTATSKDVKAVATEMGWNPGNASIELYQWRKFNGIAGRAKAA